MHVDISYKGDNTGRRAINDLIQWFGSSRTKLIFRSVRAAKTMADLDMCDMSICFGGCQGEPIRRLFAYCHGEHVLQAWIKTDNGDKTLLASVARPEMATA